MTRAQLEALAAVAYGLVFAAPAAAEVYATQALVGFFQFTWQDDVYVGVLETDADGTRATFTVGPEDAAGRHLTLRRVESEHPGIRAIDATVQGGELVLVSELNARHPLQLARTALSALLDSAAPAPRLTGLEPLALTPAQAAAVQLAPQDGWHVPTPLAPPRWLFSPRFVRGAGPLEVLVNTADGRALALGDATAPSFWLADAAEPQGCRSADGLLVAFRRFDQPYLPFWSLPRYARAPAPARAHLVVAEGRAAPRDLSTELALGDIDAFALAVDREGAPWIFALRRGARAELLVLRRAAGRWSLVAREPAARDARQLSAEPAATGWHLLQAVETTAGWSLRHRRWSPPQ